MQKMTTTAEAIAHSSCRCGASTTSLSVPTVIELKQKITFEAKKQKFGFKEAYYSSAFSPFGYRLK
jgi:hypothetical protein